MFNRLNFVNNIFLEDTEKLGIGMIFLVLILLFTYFLIMDLFLKKISGKGLIFTIIEIILIASCVIGSFIIMYNLVVLPLNDLIGKNWVIIYLIIDSLLVILFITLAIIILYQNTMIKNSRFWGTLLIVFAFYLAVFGLMNLYYLFFM